MRIFKQNLHNSVKTPLCRLMSMSPKDSNQRKGQTGISKKSTWLKTSTFMMMLVLGIFQTPSLLAQGPCTGNVAIENLADGMDYSITSDANGNVDISLTVVNNPAGLVGFLGGPGNPISFPDANGTFTYNLTGETDGAEYVLNMFFNWASGGQGNSDPVSITVNGPCSGVAPAVLDLPIDFEDASIDYELAPFGSNISAQIDVDPVDQANTVLSATKTAGADCWSGVTVGNSGLDSSIGFSATTTTFTVDVYSPLAGIPILLKVEDAANGAISSEVIALTTVANTWETLTFDFANGCAAPPNLANTYNKISIFPEFTCTPDACGGPNPGTAADTDSPLYFDNITFDGGSGPTIVAPSIPINFDDAAVDYALAPFGSNISSQLDADPTDPANMVLSTTKTAGADCWSGVTVGGSGLESPIAFTADEMYFTMDVYSPVVGAPILLKVEDATNGAIASEVIAVTTVANAWETLSFDFANGCPGAPDLSNTYDKISIFPEFTCTPDACGGPNPGTAADTDEAFFFDNISLGAAPVPCTVVAAECTACETCEESIVIDLMAGNAFGATNGSTPVSYDAATNSGSISLAAGQNNVFSAAGVANIAFPTYVNDVCFTADIDVVSGTTPFLVEFRIENGTGAPGNGGQALVFDVMVDGSGTCSVGGNIAAGTPVNGFIFDSGRMNAIVIAIADFDGTPVDSDIVVDFSNVSLTICAGDDTAPELECPNSEELLVNGDFSDLPSGLIGPADYANWNEFGAIFADGNYRLPAGSAVKTFGQVSGVSQDATVAAGDMICMDANMITNTLDGIVGTTSWAEVKIEFYDAAGDIINGPFGTVLGNYNQTTPAVANVWTNVGGCLEAPENSVTARAIVIFLNFDGNAGAIGFDDVSMRKITPMVFEVNQDDCSAAVSITNPTPTDDCEVVTFTNDFNNTDDASDSYPQGSTLVTYTALDANGNQSVCSILVEAGDTTGPTVDCPQDILVPLEPGDCEDIVMFTIPFFDECGTIDGEASQLVNDQLVNTALDCTNNTSNHLRLYENTLPVPLTISTVNVGIWNSANDEIVVVNVYEIETGADFINANMELIATTDLMVPGGTAQSILMAPIDATIPVGSSYVLELRAPNSNFIVGYNNQGETASSYLSGNLPTPCVSLEPTDIDILNGGAFVDFAVVLYSDAEGGTAITQTAGLPSGSYYQIGTTTNTFIVTDVNGNTTECTFDVIVEEFSNTSGTMTCNDNLNISLDSNCELVLGADMLLEGNSYGCYDNYLISVSGGVAGNVITEGGTYTVTVTDPNTGNSCWSTINVEDKNAPVLDCACPVGGTPIELPFTGTLDANSPIWTRPFVGGAGCNPSGVGIDIPYMTHNFAISMDNNVNAEQVTFTAPSADGFLALYADSFDPADPCGNLVITNDDGGVGFLAQFTAMLESGTQYILVVTTFNENGNDYGDYVVEMTSDAEFLELEEECNFRCVDLDYVLNSTDLTAIPGVTSCSPANLVFADEVTTDANGTQIILRTWVATNDNGTATCVQQFNFAALAISDLTLPTSPLLLSCNDGTSPEEIVALLDNPLSNDNPNTAYIENNEGFVHAYPTYLIDGHPQKVDNNVCDLYAAYTDQELDACEEGCNGNRKVIRTWTLVDWSTLETTTYTQTIKAVDSEAPTLNTQDIAVSTDAWGCVATFVVPAPWELHDNCDSAPRYYVTGPAGVTITGSFEDGFTATGAPKGTHTFNYVAYDCCGNEASYPFEVTVSDITPPVVISKQNIVVSLTSAATSEDGYAKLYAESVDNGSYDGCSDNVKLEIRRDTDNCDVKGNMTYNADNHPQDGSPNPLASNYDPDGGEFVKFCCTDLMTATVDVDGDGTNDAGYVKVWLRVWDDGDMDGTFGSDGDNYNESWSYVKVEDKLAPQITCPVDVTINCNDDYLDLTTTGEATGYGSCGGVPVEYKDVLVSLNTCNEGFVRRRWNIVGRTDIFCDQTITMEGIDAPVNVSFSAVGDKEFDCLDGISVGEPTWTAGPCDILGYTVATDTFRFEDGACYKLVNTYQVINWCDYDPNSGSTEGMWEHVQVIKVIDSTVPEIENCEDAMYAINDHADEDGDGEVCEAKLVLTNVAMDPGSDNCPTAWLKWEVVVDLWADGTPDYEYTSFIPGSSFNFNQFNTDANGNGIPDAYIKPTASGQEVSIPLVDIAGSMSNHKVKWTVTDGCNNFSSCSNDFMVVDKKAPTPYCIDISSAVMESSGTVELWAIDFNVGSFDNCTAIEDLRYTFTDVAPEDDNDYDPAQRSSSKVFTCDDVANSAVEVNMYVWDEKGNSDFCKVFLTLVDNTGACGEGKAIAGQVASESGNGVNEVEIGISSTLPEFPRLAITDEQGMYTFDNVPQNGNYGVTGVKDVDYLNGVSTLDLVKIQRHILGLESFDSPYKLVAADINADNDVKVNDLNELRKLILGVITDLPTNESWRFVDAAQVLDMDTDLEDINYEINISNLSSDLLDNNFVAVKIGDVTENASTSLLANSNIEVRSNKTLDLTIDNREVKVGELVEVSFMSENFADVYGYQFTMELNGLEFAEVTKGAIAMTEANVGVLNSNVITMSYHASKATTASTIENIFTVSFRATEAGQLSDMIAVSSKVTASEAYIGETLEIREVVISTRGEVATAASNVLYQNEPNPFKELTTINFELAEAGAVTFKVTDVTGRVLKMINTEGIKGMNIIPLQANDFATSGILYYTIESGEFTDTRKMIVVR